MKKVYVIHGYTGYPNKNWFPWLKSELEKLSVQVIVPAMPNTNSPTLSEWLNHLNALEPSPNEDTYLVGHSLGCITILRYLENLPSKLKVGGAVLVAGFASPIHLTELNIFFEKPLDNEKIKESVGEIVAINSNNDQYVPYAQAEEIRDLFGAKLIKVENGGHLNEKSGFKEFPLVLEELKRLMKI